MVGKCPILGTVQSPGDGEFSCLPTKQFDSQAIVQESTSTARRRRPSTASTARTLFMATFAFPRSSSLTKRRPVPARPRSEEHTSELQSLMRISYAVFCLKKKKTQQT